MRVVIALDKFKDSLDASTACRVVADTIASAQPGWAITTKPMADGGEGTARALIEAGNGTWIPASVHDPRGRPITAGYGWFDADRSAVVEMAAASGLALLADDDRDPLQTGTTGTGELIRAAVEQGARLIYLGVGGSATVDGGIGAATALGWQFLDRQGKPLPPVGGSLTRIAQLVPPRSSSRRLPTIKVLCDVDHRLCGPQGAAAVFGPQKGATPAMVKELDHGLDQLATLVQQQRGREMRQLVGGGAAGGLAAGAWAFLDAELVPGVDTLMTVAGLDEALRGADWVVTGEGSFDPSSLRGKVVSGIARRARDHGVRVAVLAGQVHVDPADYRAAGVTLALPITPSGMALAEAMTRTSQQLQQGTRLLLEQIG